MIARTCLLLNVLAYLAYSALFAFAPDKLLDAYGIDFPKESLFTEKLWPMMVGVLRYLGCAYFTLAFLMGHVILKKPSAGLQTAAMMNILCIFVLVHRLYLESPDSVYATPAVLKESVEKSLFAFGVMTAFTFLGLMTVQDPVDDKAKKK